MPSGEQVAAVGMSNGTIASVDVVASGSTLTSKSSVLADGFKPAQMYSGFSLEYLKNSLTPQVRTVASQQ